jgi:hypothetical protein
MECARIHQFHLLVSRFINAPQYLSLRHYVRRPAQAVGSLNLAVSILIMVCLGSTE